MELAFTGGIAAIVLFGVVGQLLGKATGIPSIILLLLLGLLVGPVLGWVNPDALLGENLFPLVSMAVSVLLFEEALKLDFSRLHGGARRPVLGLVTVGAALTGIGASLLTYWVFDLPAARAAVIGAILIVSGPTVVGPLLAIIRPRQPLESVLAFEGIFIDPIGATVALAIAHVALHEHPQGMVRTGLTGIVVGLAAAATYVLMVRFARTPASMHVVLALALALTAFAIAESFFEESGLWATTTLGVTLANQQVVRLGALHEFGSHVGALLIGSLFIVLAARVDLDALIRYAPATLGLVMLLVLVLRPVVAWIATTGTILSGRDRAMVGWMAPRGIVAASTASLFALQFEQAGKPFPQLVPVVFGVVLATAVIYGLTGPLVAARLGVRSDALEQAIDEDGVPLST
ncbi:cation:proton antiporter [Cellulomonas sp. URHE0023]|uniref:cation:proton antiporter domain-containing protein n=1 Tax=Cellulomonas sp. URHE0023 TaxID=1380354 RepID=UPI00068BF2C7|nr:cation:proton antiporter [Cellulomonas sp. URHE0023]